MNRDFSQTEPDRPRARRMGQAPSSSPGVDSNSSPPSPAGFTSGHLLSNSVGGVSSSNRDGSLMTLEQAAVQAGVSVRTLARYRKSGALEVVKVGRRVLCTLDAIQRALVRRSLQQLWRDITDVTRESDSLLEWLEDLQILAETSPGYESPAVHRAYIDEVASRHPDFIVRDYLVQHLRIIATALEERGRPLECARQLMTFPPTTTVIDALRGLHQRFGP